MERRRTFGVPEDNVGDGVGDVCIVERPEASPEPSEELLVDVEPQLAGNRAIARESALVETDTCLWQHGLS